MTIITPHIHHSLRTFLIALSFMLLLGGAWFVYEYNALVNTRYSVKQMKEDIANTQVVNADLKNSLFASIDPVKLEALAVEEGLVLERHPLYVVANGAQQ